MCLNIKKSVIDRKALYEYDLFGRLVKSTSIDTAVTAYNYNTRDDLGGYWTRKGNLPPMNTTAQGTWSGPQSRERQYTSMCL